MNRARTCQRSELHDPIWIAPAEPELYKSTQETPGRLPSQRMKLWASIKSRLIGKAKPLHLTYGKQGERAAKAHLKRHGLKFLTANFRSSRGEIDLVFRDRDCLVFIEVKTRSSEDWERPAAAVDAERRRRLTRAGLDYLHLLRNPKVKVRFDIVEVLLDNGAVREIRHLPNSFEMSRPHRYA